MTGGGEGEGIRRSQRLRPDGDGGGGEGYRDLSAFMIVNRTAGEWGGEAREGDTEISTPLS